MHQNGWHWCLCLLNRGVCWMHVYLRVNYGKEILGLSHWYFSFLTLYWGYFKFYKYYKYRMTYAWRSSSNGEKSELAKLDNEVIRLFSKCLKWKQQIHCQHSKDKFHHQVRCGTIFLWVQMIAIPEGFFPQSAKKTCQRRIPLQTFSQQTFTLQYRINYTHNKVSRIYVIVIEWCRLLGNCLLHLYMLLNYFSIACGII